MGDGTRQERIDAYVEEHSKSGAAAFLLAAIFGPLGLFYVSGTSGAVAVLAALAFWAIAPPLVVLVWLIGLIAAPVGVGDYNRRLRVKAELMAG